jgi:DNA helicase HerA-like ATPase
MGFGADDFSLLLGEMPNAVRLTLEDLCGHGLITGVTGSGKTTTAKVIAEGLSAQSVPVFAIDTKGDFAGVAQPQAGACGGSAEGGPYVRLWDPQGRSGHRFSLQRRPRSLCAPVLETLNARYVGDAAEIGVLDAVELIKTPKAYAGFLYELITQLQDLPQAGSAARPQLVVLIEEAHLLFRNLRPPERQTLIEALGRLGAAGTAVVFVAPHPDEVPDDLDAVLELRIQHALWAPSEPTLTRLHRHLGSAGPPDSTAMRGRLQRLGVSEALVAAPSLGEGPAQKVQVQRPESRDGPLTPGERRAIVAKTTIVGAAAPRRRRGAGR